MMRGFFPMTAAVLLLGAAIPGGARAATLSSDAAAKIVNSALHAFGTFQVLHTAPGPADLTAALVSAKGKRAIVWIVGDGQAVLLGRAIGSHGQDLTKDAAIAMGIVPKGLAPAAVADAVGKQGSFVVGTKGPEVIAFMDPNCIWCHRFYEQARPLIAAGKLRLRVALVGIIKTSSLPKAAAILGAKDPATALAYDERHFDTKTEEGGTAPAAHVASTLGQTLDANLKLLEQSGEAVTPTILFQDKTGEWQITHGLPRGGIGLIMTAMGEKMALPAGATGSSSGVKAN